jgi:hypothetical protein
MYRCISGSFLSKEFMHKVLLFTNRLSEVLVKLVWAIFFIAVMDKAHAVA